MRVVADTSALLTQARSGLRDSLLWLGFASGALVPLVCEDTYREFRRKLAEPRLGLSLGVQTEILTEYLSYAEYVEKVPQGYDYGLIGVDRVMLDLALWREADVLITLDGALLNLDGKGHFDLRIMRPGEFMAEFGSGTG